jgi:hypothetical protein
MAERVRELAQQGFALRVQDAVGSRCIGEMLSHLAEEFDRCLRVVVVVDAQDTKAGRFIYSGELVEAPASSSDPRDEFHIELDRAAGNLQRGIGAWGQGDTSSWRSVPRGADKKVSE